ncbi:MAG: hypothetical protein RLY16_1228 [Bacteroidota bacterium]|jgi:hypothetical protein
MNIIKKHALNNLGYQFVDPKYIPEGQDEYYLRYIQNPNGHLYRKLNSYEIEVLVRNNNTSDDWNKILVSQSFRPELVKNCQFHGLIRIGNLEPLFLEFHNLRMQVGLYNSTIISCDLGNNVCIDNVNYLSHYIIGNEVMIANVNELAATDKAKFGNGIIYDGEDEKVRVWMELCNENGGRRVLPFNGMLPGDAFLWSKYIADEALVKKFIQFTEDKFDKRQGYYGQIGDRTVIKNCKILKDVLIGTDAYLKGANKLKNLTIKSDAKRKSQIGEGCELVNGIVGYGCRVFYGVKAVRFVMASHSQLKYGARLINSYLGNNSTISCCEVLNSLIFPAHEQHHNNSFLCASMVMGQSNIAAGATIGSNHNSRSADGEIIAGRGFWPGLCVSLKHNSKFASFNIIAKGDFPAELNIPVPFSLISNDVSNNKLVVLPGYWFKYNMYALERNAWKYVDRDKRTSKIQQIEYDYLAPDTINELFNGLQILTSLQPDEKGTAQVTGWENTRRVTEILKVPQSIELFKELIRYYGTRCLIQHIRNNKFDSFESFKKSLSAKIARSNWINVGGQLMQESDVHKLKQDVKSGKIDSWYSLHDRYKVIGENYNETKLQHGYTALLEILGITSRQFNAEQLKTLLQQAIATREWMCKGIYDSRAKDYTNPFRTMIYETTEEMNKVIGKLEDNSFIQQETGALFEFKKEIKSIIRKYKL